MSIESNISNMDEDEAKDMLLDMVNETYTLVLWPDSQDYMDKKWFRKEAILATSGKEVPHSSYFIPTKRVLN